MQGLLTVTKEHEQKPLRGPCSQKHSCHGQILLMYNYGLRCIIFPWQHY